jgi:drug/metabolite transporter (DMT)-like permease
MTQVKAESFILNRETKGIFLTMLAAFCFATKTILAKLAYLQGVDPLSLIFLRMCISGLIFFGILIGNTVWGDWSLRLSPKKWLIVLVLGIGGYYLCSYLDFKGLYYIDASLGRMILFLYPTFVVIISSVISKNTIKKHTVIALLVSYLGLFLMMLPHIKVGIWGSDVLKGSSLVFLSAFIYAFYLTGVDKYFKDMSMSMLISITMVISATAVLIHFSIQGDFNKILSFSKPAFIYIILLSVFSTVIPIYSMSAGIALLGASKAAMYNMTGPIMTLLLGRFLLGEHLGPLEILGIVLIILGVLKIRG